jgi:hypothetical protein
VLGVHLRTAFFLIFDPSIFPLNIKPLGVVSLMSAFCDFVIR